MTIEVHQPELETIILRRMETGRFRDIEDVLLQALQFFDETAPSEIGSEPKESLYHFLTNSPLHGSGLEIERIVDYARPIDL